MTTPTRWAEDLIDEALRCPCDERPGSLCARCECLVELAAAIDIWAYEQMSGQSWEAFEQRLQQEDSLMDTSLWHGLGHTLLGWGLRGLYVLHAVRVGAVCAWRWGTGRNPQ